MTLYLRILILIFIHNLLLLQVVSKIVLKIFKIIKFNIVSQSSASVERLFSIGNAELSSSKGHLHDDIIKYQLLLLKIKNR